MMFSAVLATASAWLLGVVVVGALWPRERSLLGDWLVILSLGLGLGLGMTSALFFGASLVMPEPVRLAAALELLVIASFGCRLWRSRRGNAGLPSRAPTPDFWPTVLLGSIFAQGCIIAAFAAIRAYQAEPYSNSDGWLG